VERRDRFEVRVEWSVWRLDSSEPRLCRVDWRAAFWDWRAGSADVDWLIWLCSEDVIWCERCDRRASFSGLTGIGGAGMFVFEGCENVDVGPGREISKGESIRSGAGAGLDFDGVCRG